MKQKASTTVIMRQDSLAPLLAKDGARPGWKSRLPLLLLLFLPCLFLRASLDNDLWFLLNSGRYVLAHGIPVVEPFTLHHNMAFLMQQWLAAVVFWLIYSSLGAYGVLAFICLLFLCIVWVTYRLTMLLSRQNFFASFVTTLLIAVLLTQFFITRPIIFTLLILILELYFLECFIASHKVSFLFPLPILSALLINFQAAMWPMQFILLLPYAIDSFHFKVGRIQGQGYPKRFFFPAVLLMLAAGFANPYGFRAMTYLFRSYGYSEFSLIDEMKPANINTFLGLVTFGTILAVLAVYLFHKDAKTRLRYALLTFGTAILSLSAMRNYVVFLLCGVFPLTYVLRDIKPPALEANPSKSVKRLRVVLLVCFTLAMICLAKIQVSSIRKANLPPPIAAPVNFLLETEDPENVILYTGYNDGAYAEYMGFAPYIDARAEVFVPKNNGQSDIMKEYCQMLLGKKYYKEVLDQYHFTHLLVSKADILSTYLPYDTDYHLVYQDEQYSVYRLINPLAS
ncbi:MAG: hypothetical protein VB062_06000 [Christensenella sp.]|nr:hypothetical protein [Christensenella sp.]